MKIAVFGYSGSGKSTLAGKLAEKYEVPVLYLDCVHWLPGWVENEKSVKENAVEAFLESNESWLIDGTYKKLFFERRMDEADLVVFMSLGRFTCFYRVLKRYFQNKGKSRPSMTDGCDERINFEFFKWVLFDGRTRKRRESLEASAEKYKDKTVIIRTARQLNRFYKDNGLCY